MNLHERLLAVQTELKAPKNQRNNFGKYNYRSCEDILEALKPLLKKYELSLIITDHTTEIHGTLVIDARVIIGYKDKEIIASAQAGINLDRKGMDIAQSFGSSSSYARKYALNGMFLIDDTKDADATNTHNKLTQKPPLTKDSDKYIKAVEFIAGGGSISVIEKSYTLSKDVKDALETVLKLDVELINKKK